LRGLAAHGLEAPLIGRDGELAHVLSVALRVAEGGAQVISLVGQAGVGKTRLVDSLLERLAVAPGFGRAAVRRVVCSSVGPRPYGMTAGLFREAYGIAPTDSLEAARGKVEAGLRALGAAEVEVELVVPVVGYILGLQSVERSSEIEPERLKRQISMTMRTVLERRLVQGPLVLVLEDLQWADAAVARRHAHAGRLALRAPAAGGDDGPAAVRSGRLRLRPCPAHRAAARAACRRRDRRAAGRVLRRRRRLSARACAARAHRSPGRRQSAVPRGSRSRAHRERGADPEHRR
jgi:hypothetical protein